MFERMDKTDIQIANIKDLKMVHIYELTGSDSANLSRGCSAVAVYYGEHGKINLSEMDPHYEKLMCRVTAMYAATEDKAAVLMNDSTRSMLENGMVIRYEKDIKEYYGMEPLDYPELLPVSVLGHRYLSFAEYLTVGFYRILGTELNVTKEQYGWRGAGTFTAYDGEKEYFFYVKTEEISRNRVKIHIPNFLEGKEGLEITLGLYSDRAEAFYRSQEDTFFGDCLFTFEQEKMYEVHHAFHKRKQVLAIKEEHPALPGEELDSKLLPAGKKAKSYYKLPGDLIYVLYDENHIEGALEIHDGGCAYLFEAANLMEFISYTEIKNTQTQTRIKMDEVRMIRQILPGHRIQTYFVPGGQHTSWAYQQKLEGKYFLESENKGE